MGDRWTGRKLTRAKKSPRPPIDWRGQGRTNMEITITLSGEDLDRLYAIKGQDQTPTEYARELLIDTLHTLHPQAPKYDSEGRIIHAVGVS